ncbi:hypothetical protein Tco_1124618 [Tanacetum coccineum]|uniref:F-box domain-containing protein n=1 Tax=Tanacetum coccineum TaxID=301880 RepID=A0ABQ5J9H2_9ASTR
MMSQTRSTRGRENSAQPHLVFTNNDLLTEILIRLPILCIHLFTTVSKQWLQILTSSHFTDRRRKIPILDPPAGIFANHLRYLFESDCVSLDPRLKSRKSAMDSSFTLGSNKETYHINILQSCNGLILCSDIPAILHLQRRLFESYGCLFLVSRDDIDSKEFTIYEMVKGYPVWTVSQIFDIGSNEMDDEYELFPSYKVAHNPYEFIPSFASV